MRAMMHSMLALELHWLAQAVADAQTLNVPEPRSRERRLTRAQVFAIAREEKLERILNVLRKDGRSGTAQIVEKTSLCPRTTQTYLRDLLDSGKIRCLKDGGQSKKPLLEAA